MTQPQPQVRQLGSKDEDNTNQRRATLDLSAEPIGRPDPSNLTSEPYDPKPRREEMRGRLAQILIWAVVVAIAGPLALLAFGSIHVQDLPSVVAASSPLMGIAGAAVGFYFGGDDSRQT